ncbi:MAG: Uma2 family endonuclease [Gomphosphaeria aponina SAG 52.96 = DSM 107014]|uniref:Uma2 family endonuclease n=1 Tax=Gomphosphaeria aponina SAG 52.96 = DSM 107014 TaxID=1521640 RepID=A0A941GWT8_9CHRO|nr:Uma2 family endonuclease [Gomphosphaeria aponina SAG 52.96 = DSM 107014]
MAVTIPLPTIQLAPGSKISIPDLSWQKFEAILQDLGENRNTRITYYQGILEIMSPLALHERPHRIIAYIITAILEKQGRNWEDFGSTTLKYPEIAGIEPDTCFYIQNADLVKGCTNLDLSKYPPPDLAIECDVTSKTAINAYQALRVPEVWIYSDRQLQIYIFSEQGYYSTASSPTFPDLPIIEIIPQLIQKAIERGTSQMLKEFKASFSKN